MTDTIRVLGSVVAIAAMAWIFRRIALPTIGRDDRRLWPDRLIDLVVLTIGMFLTAIPGAIGGRPAFGAALVVIVVIVADALFRPEWHRVRRRRHGSRSA